MSAILKKLLYILIFITLPIYLKAQQIKKINFALQAGYNYPIVYKNYEFQYLGGNDYYDAHFKSTFGYYCNLSIDIYLNKKFAISPGIFYQKNKLKLERHWIVGAMDFGLDKGTVESSYLTLPIILKYSFREKIPISIGLGPYLGFLLNSEDKGIGYGGNYYNNNIQNSTFYYKQIDFGLIAQINCSFMRKDKIDMYIFSEFQSGLVNAKKQIESDDSKWINLNWIVGLGVLLK